MNLRDQFLKAGLVSKKDVQQTERELRKQEKIAQGNKENKRILEQRAAEEAEKRRLEAEAELVRRRREARERDLLEMRILQSRQILRHHRLRVRKGPQRFYYRAFNGRELWRLDVGERIADDLRRGRLVICWIDDAEPETVIVDTEVADRVEAIRPELILFRNRGGVDPDPAEQLYEN